MSMLPVRQYGYPHIGADVSRFIDVVRLYTVHYFENQKEYVFPGEFHDFWEIVYVSQGQIVIEEKLYGRPLTIEQGGAFVIRPNMYHQFKHESPQPFSLFIISFQCSSAAMEQFYHVPFYPHTFQYHRIIADIICEAQRSFLYPLFEVRPAQIELSSTAQPGCLQMICLNLERLLVSLYRDSVTLSPSAQPAQAPPAEHGTYVGEALLFLKKSLYTKIAVDDVCRHVGVSQSQLQKAFASQQGCSVMAFLRELRVDESKYLIRRRQLSMADIADLLCFNSVHHFSNVFKKTTGMSPTGYSKSLQAIMDGTLEGTIVRELE